MLKNKKIYIFFSFSCLCFNSLQLIPPPDNTKIFSQCMPFTVEQSIQSTPLLPQSLLLAILTSPFSHYHCDKEKRENDDNFFNNSVLLPEKFVVCLTFLFPFPFDYPFF